MDAQIGTSREHFPNEIRPRQRFTHQHQLHQRQRSIEIATEEDSPTEEARRRPQQLGNLQPFHLPRPAPTPIQVPNPSLHCITQARFVSRIVYDTILRNVNEKIHSILEFEKKPGYDGLVKEVNPSGVFDYDHFSYFHKDNNNPFNVLIAGDKQGNVLLLDLNKKTAIVKKEITPGKRIIHIHSSTVRYGSDGLLTTCAIIARGDPTVTILRFRSIENKLFTSFTIRTSQLKPTEINDKTELNDFPYSCTLSNEGRFISINTYCGDVLVYAIPEAPAPVIPNEGPSPTNITAPKISSGITGALPGAPSTKFANEPMALTGLQHSSSTGNVLGDGPPLEISKILLKIKSKLPKKVISSEETLRRLKEANKPPEPETEVKGGKVVIKQGGLDTKKPAAAAQPPAKPGVKIDPKAAAAAVDPNAPDSKGDQQEFETNAKPVLGPAKTAPNGNDIAEDIAIPKYRPETYFLTEKITLPKEDVTFGKMTELDLTTKILVAWIGTNSVDVYGLQPRKKEFLPVNFSKKMVHVSDKVEVTSGISKKSGSENRLLRDQVIEPYKEKPLDATQIAALFDAYERKLIKTWSLSQILIMTTASQTRTLLALAMNDCSILVWDLVIDEQKYILDRHFTEVRAMSFYEDWVLCSGSQDGIFHMYDMTTGHMVIDYPNDYKSLTPVISIVCSERGFAYALNESGSLRMFDIFHMQKVAKFSTFLSIEPNITRTIHINKPVIIAMKEQLCILVRKQMNPPKKDKEESKQPPPEDPPTWQNPSHIMLYRSWDNLLNIYPGLANLYRKNVNKHLIWNALSKLSWKEVQQENFQLTGMIDEMSPAPLALASRDSRTPQGSRVLKSGDRSFSKESSVVDLNSTYNPRKASRSTR
jgi:hypothetical protein